MQPVSILADVLDSVRRLQTFDCNWTGPCVRLLNDGLNVLPLTVQRLSFSFDLDRDSLEALVQLKKLDHLDIRQGAHFKPQHSALSARSHCCGALSNFNTLPNLRSIRCPPAKVFARGRVLHSVTLSRVLSEDRDDQDYDLLPLTLTARPLEALCIRVTGNGGAHTLSILSEHRNLNAHLRQLTLLLSLPLDDHGGHPELQPSWVGRRSKSCTMFCVHSLDWRHSRSPLRSTKGFHRLSCARPGVTCADRTMGRHRRPFPSQHTDR